MVLVMKRKKAAQMMRRLCHRGWCHSLDISNSDNEETRKVAVCKKARKSDIQYAAWQDEQIRQGNDDIAKRDKRVHNHTDIGKHCKAPDKIGPPLTYMEEHGVFKPLDTIVNPMGLCRFYCMSSKKSNVFTGPKSTESACKIKDMIKVIYWYLVFIRLSTASL